MGHRIQSGEINGALTASGLRFGVVVSRFNSFITERLMNAAIDALRRAGAADEDIVVVHVPGAFELPLAAKKLAATGTYDALISVGCVLRGETSHYDTVCDESARGLTDLAIQFDLAIGNGILTVENEQQAWARAKPDEQNKGGGAAEACLAMVALKRQLGLTA